MIEVNTEQGRIISAALRLAAEKPWREVTLRQIADAAGASLIDLRRDFSAKSDIIAAFMRHVDDEVLKAAPAPAAGQSRRDALFEVVMARFDALQPHKEALRSIVADTAMSPALFWPMMRSQAWMLEAAGIDSDGPEGKLRTAGLGSVYASVFRTWLDDDDPGQARTMAVLDRRLRRGEQVIETFDGLAASLRRFADMVRSGTARSRTRDGDESNVPPSSTSSTTADAPGAP